MLPPDYVGECWRLLIAWSSGFFSHHYYETESEARARGAAYTRHHDQPELILGWSVQHVRIADDGSVFYPHPKIAGLWILVEPGGPPHG
jgi:hypothetical protein